MHAQPCRICSKLTTTWCSRCKDTWYCSAQHLENDWTRHRLECIPANFYQTHGAHASSSPHPVRRDCQSVDGIFFAPDEERPRIISVNCFTPKGPLEGSCPRPDIHDFFPDGFESVIITQGLNNETLRFPLHVFYSPTDLGRRSPVNRAIQHITLDAAEKPWCGPVLVLKYLGTRRNGYADANTMDFPALSLYFLAYS